MEFFKLLGVILVVPFATAMLYLIVLSEKIGQIYGTNVMLVVVIATVVIPGYGFLKDFWSGMIAIVVIGMCWAMVAQKLL